MGRQKCETCDTWVDFGYHSCFDELTRQLLNGGAVTAEQVQRLRKLYLGEVRKSVEAESELRAYKVMLGALTVHMGLSEEQVSEVRAMMRV